MTDNNHELNTVSTALVNDDLQPSRQEAWLIAQAADARKAADIAVLQVSEVSYLADYFVIATGFSKTQVRAIADSIEKKMAEERQKHPLRVAGKAQGSWILLDYGDVIAHIFLPQERDFYNLEAFWGHAQRLDFQERFNPQES
ncbi:MAG: ribosome silencing factor [Cyanophyceae cyanobacterium]